MLSSHGHTWLNIYAAQSPCGACFSEIKACSLSNSMTLANLRLEPVSSLHCFGNQSSVCLSVCLSVCPPVCLSVYLFVCLCVCVCLSVCSRSLSHGRSAHGVALAGPHTDAFNQTVANLNQRNQPFEPNRRNLNWIRNRTGGTGEPNP